MMMTNYPVTIVMMTNYPVTFVIIGRLGYQLTFT